MRLAVACAPSFHCVVPIGTVRIAVWYHLVPMSRVKESRDAAAVRERILTAAFEAIRERAKRFQASADMPMLCDRETLAQVLTAFGIRYVREVSDPHVVAVFRLAIAEAVQAPEVAQTLDSLGRETGRAA